MAGQRLEATARCPLRANDDVIVIDPLVLSLVEGVTRPTKVLLTRWRVQHAAVTQEVMLDCWPGHWMSRSLVSEKRPHYY